MNAKTKKLALIGAAAVVLCAGIFMALQAFNKNLVFFFSPTQVAAKEAPVGRTFRLGGVVEKNSVVREKDGVTVHFRITDTAQKSRALLRRANSTKPVCLSRVKCSLSMTKTTCRLRPPKRSKMRIRPA